MQVKLQKKNNLLKQMGSHAVDVAYLKPVWQEFTQTMDAFHAMLDEQREVTHTHYKAPLGYVQHKVDITQHAFTHCIHLW
jgi:hypothetical protein